MKAKNKILALITPPAVFLLLAITVGVLLVFINPPFEAPDEGSHFKRAFQISEGGIFATKNDQGVGGVIPKNISGVESFFRNWLSDKRNATSFKEISEQTKINIGDEREFAQFPNTALYSPLPYLPPIIGILLARLFSDSVLWIFYSARIVNLLFYLLLVFLAIKTAPVLKWVFLMLGALPMSLFLAASASPDALTIGLSFIFIAYILKLALGEKTLTKVDFALLLILAIAISLAKTAYLLLPLLILIIPKAKFANIKTSYLYKSVILAAAFISGLGWYLVANRFFVPILPEVNPSGQLVWILSHPLYYLHFFIYHLVKWFSDPASQSIIGQFGWLDTFLPLWVISSYKIVLVVTFLFEEKQKIISAWGKIISFLIFFATAEVITLIMYLTWNSVGSDKINGLQGRYFLPLLPLLFISLYGGYSQTKKRLNLTYLVPIYLLIVLYVMLKTLIYRYYF